MQQVTAWEELVTIPTYNVGVPEKMPIFLEKRVYQGSSGVVYPYPVIEKIEDEKKDVEWSAVFLENEYLKVMVLPELGGRVQMAYDKLKKRHFVYYNEVIKPALVGLTGPWISGGIEFNWPQHPRPTTYSPVDYQVEQHKDGSKTVWCSEIERMFRTKGMAGFTLHPDRAYLEIIVKLYNRTSEPQTFLWWANPAVAVNDHYQSVFPPDVSAVFDHGKRDVSRFPIAKGTYYKVDYSPGTDISKYKNIPVPTSYMAIRSDYDFVGGYENDTGGGLLHVANHHISPGKKQWTWGNGDFGKAWDRNLTDTNGPYVELMCGVYTDNQPDFSWLMPYEEKSFRQYFIPYQDIGVVKNATKDIMLNLEVEGETARIRVYATGVFSNARIILTTGEETVWEETFDFKPGNSYEKKVEIPPGTQAKDYHLAIEDSKGEQLLAWSPESPAEDHIPEPAKPAKAPGEIESNEALYLNGLHLEQYRHATYSAVDYYREALKRDPADSRCNNALGMWLFRRGKFNEAEACFRKACQTITQRNPNPYDGEPFFNLGLSLRLQGRDDEAYSTFYKAVWNASWAGSGYFHIAQLEAGKQQWAAALEAIDRSLAHNWHHHKARHLKVVILRHKGLNGEAEKWTNDSLALDGFNFGVIYEQYLLGDVKQQAKLKSLLRGNIQTYIEIALDYGWAGLYEEAIALLDEGISQQNSIYPMAFYYKAWLLNLKGKKEAALTALYSAEACAPEYCFPNRIEAVCALSLAQAMNPRGAKAPYYLGNFWYNARQYEDALQCWEESAKLDDTFPTVFRNLALAYYNKCEQPDNAQKALESAFRLDPTNSRILMELDQLYKKLNQPVNVRLAFLEKHLSLVMERDDLYLERIYLYLLTGHYSIVYDLLMTRQFHPWEGGEGKVTKAYSTCLINLAKQSLEKDQSRKAVKFLKDALRFPPNLGEGKLHGAQENDVYYWLGCAYHALDMLDEAHRAWAVASNGLSEPAIAWFYNDPQPDTLYYQGLALLKLGKKTEAENRFQKLIDFGNEHLHDEVKIDYFAVSLPDLLIWDENLKDRNRMHCHYMMALGYKGKKMQGEAKEHFAQVMEIDRSHLGACMLH